MKIRINESQLEKLEKLNSYKNIVFKYWDKFGPKINNTMIKMLGVGDTQSGIGMPHIQLWLREYLGKGSLEIMNKFFSKKVHIIDDCGGYEFTFVVDDFYKNGHIYEIDITIDDVNGTVMLLSQDGSIHKLSKIIHEEEFGWEIANEVQDCVYEYFIENIEYMTGFSFVFGIIRYKSDLE